MWIERNDKKTQFLRAVKALKSQVLVVRGARQVGKTSFILNALDELDDFQKIYLNLSFKRSMTVGNEEFFGRDYFGDSENAEGLLYNISVAFGEIKKITKPIIVFIDEADRHPISLEAIQTLAGLSDYLKVVYTGSNLENISVKNAATGRKQFFDLYPVTFVEFLAANSKEKELSYLKQISLSDRKYSQDFHNRLTELFQIYLRLGGMPKIIDSFVDVQNRTQPIPAVISDLVFSIEENVKTVLGEKTGLYEYEDVLRKIAILSMDTLKFSKLQVQHAGRSEAKKLVNKTVGARVAHKIKLYDNEGSDLSKYIIFDSGVLNYLLNGSDLLGQGITEAHLGIQYEAVVGCEIISQLVTRDDLFYWKSARGAQADFLIKAPVFAAIDVKACGGRVKSLDSAAVYENELDCIIKIGKNPLSVNENHLAVIPNLNLSRKIKLAMIPHYLSGRILELFR